jgi:hypothetical protein
MNRNSSVGIAAYYGLDGRASIPDRGKRSYSTPRHTSCGAHPASYTVDIGGFFPGVKRLGCEAKSPPSSAEDMNGGAIPPVTHMSPWHGGA